MDFFIPFIHTQLIKKEKENHGTDIPDYEVIPIIRAYKFQTVLPSEL